MQIARFLGGLLLAAALHAAGTRLAPGLPEWVDLFLVATVVAARHGHPEGGLFAGLAAGWAADVLSGGPFALFGFANAAVGYGAATAARNLVVARPGSIAALFALASAAQGVIILLLAFLGLAGPSVPAPLSLLVKVATSALLGLLWLRLQAQVAARFRRRRGSSGGSGEMPTWRR